MNVILPTKSCVVDPIPTTLLKTYSDDLVPLICRSVNESLLSGSFPLLFKEVVVPPSLLKRKRKALMQTV